MMLTFNANHSGVENPAITDSDGDTFWVGITGLSGEARPVRGDHPALLKSAARAGCPAARLVIDAKDDEKHPFVRLLAAVCLRREMTMRELASELGVGCGYLNQLSGGGREPENISDQFAALVAEVAQLPRLVVMFIAGRVERSLFSELGQSGEAAAHHIAEMAANALADGRRQVEEAEARVIAEERRVRAARKVPARVA